MRKKKVSCALTGLAVLAVSVAMAAAASASPSRLSASEKAQLKLVPAALRGQYSDWWYLATIRRNPYSSWKAYKKPSQLCYASTYEGNTWRQDATAVFKSFVSKEAKTGLVKPKLLFTNSNLDVNTTISDINDLVNEGCNVIVTIAPSPTGLCAAAHNAFAHHVMVISTQSMTNCKDILNIGFNEYTVAYRTATWLGHHVKSGNILELSGPTGSSETLARNAAFSNAMKTFPHIKVVGDLTGNFTETVAKTVTLSWIGTHPGVQVAGIYNGGLMGVGAGQAFQQSGLKLPLLTGYAGSCGQLAFWKQNHLNSISASQGPTAAMNETLWLTTRMLEGHQPRINTIFYPLPTFTNATLGKWFKSSMTLQSTCFSEPPSGYAVPNSYFKPFFNG